MTTTEFYQTIKKIAGQSPVDPLNPPRRVNGFAVLQSRDALNSESLEKTAAMARAGEFWGRAWSESGKPYDFIKWEFPLLAVRRIDQTNAKGSFCNRFELAVIDLPKCEGCDYERTPEMVDEDIQAILRSVTDTLRNYHGRTMDFGTGFEKYWMSDGEWAYHKANAIPSQGLSCGALNPGFENEGAFRFDTFGGENFQTVSTVVKICGCPDESVAPNYAWADGDETAAVVKCSTC